ncbi:MAG: cell division protein FtsW [Gemmatimonadetes bacterium]|nr:cell division protein FtsW [Gemmatimonadota bacterium]
MTAVAAAHDLFTADTDGAGDATIPAGTDTPHAPLERERWRMTAEARALVLLTAALLAWGLAVLYSASAIVAIQEHRAGSYYVLRQGTGVLAGIVIFAIAAKVDAERWQQWAWPLMALSLVTMLLVILPFTEKWAPRVLGSRRFLIGSALQPSELAKLAVVVWTAMLVVKKGDTLRRLTKGLGPFLVVIGALDLFAALEPDLSAAMMFTLVMGVVLFAGGVRIGHVVALVVIATPLLWHEMQRLTYVLNRLVVFFDPSKGLEQVNYQLKQSLIAVGSGGLFGVGFGEGRQQLGYLPLPFNDFIAGNIGEEWGFVGIAGVTLVFALWAWLGFRIARQARSTFLQLTAIGLTFTIVLTAFLHIGVAIGLLPTTGLTLPFISYGRSNLLLSLLMTGILVNIGSRRERVSGELPAPALPAAA